MLFFHGFQNEIAMRALPASMQYKMEEKSTWATVCPTHYTPPPMYSSDVHRKKAKQYFFN